MVDKRKRIGGNAESTTFFRVWGQRIPFLITSRYVFHRSLKTMSRTKGTAFWNSELEAALTPKEEKLFLSTAQIKRTPFIYLKCSPTAQWPSRVMHRIHTYKAYKKQHMKREVKQYNYMGIYTQRRRVIKETETFSERQEHGDCGYAKRQIQAQSWWFSSFRHTRTEGEVHVRPRYRTCAFKMENFSKSV